MRNYNEQVEAAYLMSKRQGDMMRNRSQEQSSHDDRRNRFLPPEYRGSNQFSHYSNYYSTPDQSMPKRNNAGKGPKNYRRSDDRLREVVCDRLTDDPELDATNIVVEVVQGDVILSGSVTDRESKRLADSLAHVSGSTHVENRIRVEGDGLRGSDEDIAVV
jgi:hypothetical protein